jgi:hypothetical protein
MSFELIPETGAGVTGANTYVSLEDADAYFDARLNATDWSGEELKRSRALVMATRLIDRGLCWRGSRVYPEPALAWPRSGVPTLEGDATIDSATIPQILKDEVCELALALLREDRIGAANQPPQVGSSTRAGSKSFPTGAGRTVLTRTNIDNLRPLSIQGVSRLTRAA